MSLTPRLGILSTILVLLAVTNGEGQPNKVENFMRLKLLHSQKVLEGLTVENLELVAQHSQQMSLLSQAANWQVLQTEEYLHRSTEFRRAADALTEAAKAKNLDAATLAYVDVTTKCVSCHKYVRRVRNARLDRPLDLLRR